jgi:hypothetical protein
MTLWDASGGDLVKLDDIKMEDTSDIIDIK